MYQKNISHTVYFKYVRVNLVAKYFFCAMIIKGQYDTNVFKSIQWTFEYSRRNYTPESQPFISLKMFFFSVIFYTKFVEKGNSLNKSEVFFRYFFVMMPATQLWQYFFGNQQLRNLVIAFMSNHNETPSSSMCQISCSYSRMLTMSPTYRLIFKYKKNSSILTFKYKVRPHPPNSNSAL